MFLCRIRWAWAYSNVPARIVPCRAGRIRELRQDGTDPTDPTDLTDPCRRDAGTPILATSHFALITHLNGCFAGFKIGAAKKRIRRF